jgi:hypothetical protein
MVGASKVLWSLALSAALPLLLSGCGSKSDPNATTQFRPVDDEAPPTEAGSAAKSSQPADEMATKPDIGQAAPAKTSAATKPPPSSTSKSATGKGATSKSATGKGATGKSATGKGATSKAEAAPSDDPALTGSSGAKVRRIRSLMDSLNGELEGDTREAKEQFLLDKLQQTMQAAEEVVADGKAPAAARDEALFARFQVASMMMMKAGQDEETKELLGQVAADLATAEDTQLATLGRVQLFKLHVVDVLKLQPADAQEVLTALDTLLEAGGDVDIITREVMPLVTQLEQFGYGKEGVMAIAKIGDHFAASKDPKEALLGKQLQVSGLVGKLRGGEGDAAALGDELVAKTREIVEAAPTDRGGINLLFQLAHAQEGDFPDLAGKLYDLIEEKYAEHGDEKTAAKAKELVVSGRQRLSLVGKPLAITGVLVGGDPFDWTEYQGKVVLVHFWAISSKASLQDLSEKDGLHRKYQGRGLNLVGVNLDLNVKQVEQLFEAQQLPWPTVTGGKPSERGFKHPAAKACGVIAEALPFSVLVGKDGKVVAAGLQGPPLDEAIVKLLAVDGEAPQEKDKSDDKPADDKPADDKPADDKAKEGESDAQPDGKQPEESVSSLGSPTR